MRWWHEVKPGKARIDSRGRLWMKTNNSERISDDSCTRWRKTLYVFSSQPPMPGLRWEGDADLKIKILGPFNFVSLLELTELLEVYGNCESIARNKRERETKFGEKPN